MYRAIGRFYGGGPPRAHNLRLASSRMPSYLLSYPVSRFFCTLSEKTCRTHKDNRSDQGDPTDEEGSRNSLHLTPRPPEPSGHCVTLTPLRGQGRGSSKGQLAAGDVAFPPSPRQHLHRPAHRQPGVPGPPGKPTRSLFGPPVGRTEAESGGIGRYCHR